jgi:4'-phosphopantetheinyl transferase EntD
VLDNAVLAPNVFYSLSHSTELEEYRLLPEELKSLSPRATEKRRRELLLGRIAARRALVQLGFKDGTEVGVGLSREPLWPEGVVGSIAHTKHRAIAIVAAKSCYRSLGVDLLAENTVLRHDISKHILTPLERRWLVDSPDISRRILIAFAAKESIYKALFPLCQRYIGFQEAVIEFESPGILKVSLEQVLAKECGLSQKTDPALQINYHTSEGFIVTVLTVNHHSSTKLSAKEPSNFDDK